MPSEVFEVLDIWDEGGVDGDGLAPINFKEDGDEMIKGVSGFRLWVGFVERL